MNQPIPDLPPRFSELHPAAMAEAPRGPGIWGIILPLGLALLAVALLVGLSYAIPALLDAVDCASCGGV